MKFGVLGLFVSLTVVMTNAEGFKRNTVEKRPSTKELPLIRNLKFNAHSYSDRPIPWNKQAQYIRPFPLAMRDANKATSDYKVVCYLESWAIYRPEPMDPSPADIDPFGCTHVIFSFLGLDHTNLTVTILDKEYEVIRGGFKATLALKHINPELKVMIAIGGWAEGGKQYSQMVSSKATRTRFIDSVLEFMSKYEFDGLDFDWEYPGASDRDGVWADKENFALLIEELSRAFAPLGLLLSAAVPAANFRVNEGYDVPRLAKALDFINVMTYDMHGTWDDYADHHAPLKRRPFDEGPTQNLHADGALSYWVSQGAPANKIIFGIPFYGRNFQLADANNNKPRALIKGDGDAGSFTKEPGYVAYYEICTWLQEGGWEEHLDPAGSPYMVKGDQWVGYDSVDFIRTKMEYVKEHGLGGAMIWAIGLDDIQGVCGPKWPLLTAINEGLGRKPASTPETVPSVTPESEASSTVETAPSAPSVTPEPEAFSTVEAVPSAPIVTPEPEASSTTEAAPSAPDVTPETMTTTTTTQPPAPSPPVDSGSFQCPGNGYFADPNNCNTFYRCEGTMQYSFSCPSGLYFDEKLSVCNWPFLTDCATKKREMTRRIDDYKVLCYFSSWSWLRQANARFVPENIIPKTCTHVLYAYAGLDPQDLTLRATDKWTDIYNMFYSRITALKETNPSLVVMLAVGGWTDSLGDTYSRLVSSPSSRKVFVAQATDFLIQHGFDGLHLDWQYPVCWQADCSKGPASDRANYVFLAQELKQMFEKKGLVLGVNVAGYSGLSDMAFDGAQLAKSADYITVPAYDFHGSWERVTGHTAPLTGSGSDNVAASMKYWVSKGVPAKKLMMGIPFYGQTFTLDKPANAKDQAAIGVRTRGAGLPGSITQQAGMLAYFEICTMVRKFSWNEENSKEAPFAYRGNQWVGYDNVESVRRKAEHIKSNGYGGAMIWSIDMDDFNNNCCAESFPLTKTIARVLGIRDDKPLSGENCERPPPPVTPAPATLTTGYDSGESTTTSKPTTALTTPSTTSSTSEETTTKATTTKATTTKTTTTRPPSSSAPQKPTTTEPVVTETQCENGKYYPVPGDCASFYRCINGERQKSQCSPGLLWNTAETLCDWPHNVKCDSKGSGSGTVVKSTTTAAPTTTAKQSTSGSNMRPCREGDYSQRSGPNCSAYQRCVNGRLVEETCPSGLYWNQLLRVCDWPYNVNCPMDTQTTTPSTGLLPTTKPTRPVVTTTTTKKPRKPTAITTTTTKKPITKPTKTSVKPTTTTATHKPSQPGEYKVICYYTNWSWYRQGAGKYSPNDIDADLCTHIIFGFATLNANDLVMQVFDTWCDIDEYGPKLYSKVTDFKSKGIKVLIALGGWNDSEGNKYSRMVNDPAARKKFIDNALIFIEKYGFDGLDLDWEYPKCWQVDCQKGPSSDKPAFAALVSELRSAFDSKGGLLLSAAVSPSKTVIDAGYDVPSISRDLDWIGVMTYDYFGNWDKTTGHVAPLYAHSEVVNTFFNANYTLSYWMQLGGDPKKIIMGIPLYGQSFTLADANSHGLNAPSSGAGQAGEFTRQAGFLSYYEICKSVKNGGWNVVQDSEGAMGPYAYRDRQWVSFDDVAMIRKKSEVIRTMGIGGAMIWALDLDDFRNTCGCEPYPLLKTINRVLRNYPSTVSNCLLRSNELHEDSGRPSSNVKQQNCTDGTFKPDRSNCSGYFHCTLGKWKPHSCPPNLQWNKDRCDWPRNSKCALKKRFE